MNRKKNRTFAIIGLGNFGATVASELVRFGNYVIGLDSDRKVVGHYAEKLSQAMVVDSRDEAALREAGVGDCDVALIAMGENLESSVLTAINLRMIGVPTVWAKAVSKSHHRILSKLGVDRIIHPEEEVGRHTAQVLHNPLVRDYVSLGNGFHVVSFRVPESLEGRSVHELKLRERHDLRCIGVMRGAEYLGDDGAPVTFAEQDRLLLLGTRQNLRDFAATL
ncbi:potassium channel family protein [Limimaricola pyoseonensis]|uniref:Trk system potassium uptake protein TrkA n=1 Tax=Limimaricola pyoseonensis TaxID=521013 RepID=A0A1G7C9N7_9RHOB|nr:TrkA family potassium uptake protein [Limimaricola pyoseonensis]SDE35923.1 trk system potassium uptake protein TrkA [Limimaricola pyoseonensis]